MLGQLLGDFAINSVLQGRHSGLALGVRAHRALDRYTDAHPSFIEGSRLLAGGCGRYAPVVMDVLMDRVLVMHWDTVYSTVSFDTFLEQMYAAIARFEGDLPERMQRPAYRMRTMDWFSGFGEEAAFERVFYYMSKRVRRPEFLLAAPHAIEAHWWELERLSLDLLSEEDLISFSSGRFC